MLQRHGALVVEDQRHWPVDRLDPVAQLVGVADRGRKPSKEHMRGRVDDRLFPDRAALGIAEEMELIKNDTADT